MKVQRTPATLGGNFYNFTKKNCTGCTFTGLRLKLLSLLPNPHAIYVTVASANRTQAFALRLRASDGAPSSQRRSLRLSGGPVSVVPRRPVAFEGPPHRPRQCPVSRGGPRTRPPRSAPGPGAAGRSLELDCVATGLISHMCHFTHVYLDKLFSGTVRAVGHARRAAARARPVPR